MIKNEDFIQEFVEEAREHLDHFEGILLSDQDAINDEQINNAFRAVHSIKGTAGFFGLNQIVAIAHSMESIMDFYNRKKSALKDAEIDLLLEAKDRLKELVNDVKNSESYPIDDILEKLQVAQAGVSNQGEKIADKQTVALPDNGSQFFTAFTFNHETEEKIASFRKFGHHIYGIDLILTEHYLENNGGPAAIIDNIKSVTNIIELVTKEGDSLQLDDLKNGQFVNREFLLLASSILEESFLIQVLGLAAENLHILPENWENTGLMQGFISPDENQPGAMASGDAVAQVETGQIQTDSQAPLTLDESDLMAEKKLCQHRVDNAESLRVNIRLLDDLMNLASELVLGRNRLLSLLEPEMKHISELPPVLQNVDRLTSSIQEKIMLTRMQPVGTLFNRYPRLIRDLSKKLNKKLQLNIEGGDVELDKSILEGLSDPLVHLLRNAADHGIESAAIRQQKGKPETATISLSARYEGSVVSIEISDDGTGIDSSKIVKTALEKNLYSENELSLMSEKDLLQIIFEPGFSTADHLSVVSGRGVGMDVVRTNLEKLGGSVELSTKHGQGTSLKLSMPLTVSIIQSLVVASGGIKMVIPQADVHETIKIKQEFLHEKIESINGKDFYRLRNELLPVIYLCDLWHPNQSCRSDSDHKLVVLKLGLNRFGLLVEALLGIEETLIKPLPAILKECGIYSGLTIMGDGKVAPILDITGIAKKTALVSDKQNQPQTAPDSQGLKTVKSDSKEDFILFKGTGNETLALKIALIKRIDKIKKDELEQVGDDYYISRDHQPLKLIRAEDYLAINSGPLESQHYYVITPKLISSPIGILAKEIIENVSFDPVLDAQQFKMKGMVGATVYNERIVLLINLDELLEAVEADLQKGEQNVENSLL